MLKHYCDKICDRCGREIRDNDFVRVDVDGDKPDLKPEDYFLRFYSYEICGDCYRELKRFMLDGVIRNVG